MLYKYDDGILWILHNATVKMMAAGNRILEFDDVHDHEIGKTLLPLAQMCIKMIFYDVMAQPVSVYRCTGVRSLPAFR